MGEQDSAAGRGPALPALLGGEPRCAHPLHIVRPRFPKLETFAPAFEAALATGTVTNHQRAVQDLEARLADYTGAEVVVCSSGQVALMVMLRAAGIDSGEVIVPSYTFSASPHAIRWCGAAPVFADIGGKSGDDDDLRMDAGKIEALINDRTTAILGVDVYGLACDYETLSEVGRRHGIRVLFDSAPAFGTKVGGRPVGAFGDAQIFSFHATKAFATMEGGCLVSKDPELLRRARAIRNFGQVAGADCEEPGLNAKMTEVCALIGLEQMKHFEEHAANRRRAVAKLREGLSGIPGLSFAKVPAEQEPIWLYFPIVIDAEAFGLDRDELAAVLEHENLHVRKYFELPCHHMQAYADSRRANLPETERVAYSVVALPVYNDMTDEECTWIVEAIAQAHRHSDALRGELGRRKERS